MSTLRYLVIWSLFQFYGWLYAGQLPDLTQVSIAEAQKLATKAVTGLSAEDFGKAALASGRYEMVDLCWEYPYISLFINEAMRKMPVESKERDALIVMMMQNPRMPWPNPNSFDGGGDYGARAIDSAGYVIPLLRKYLPDLPIKYSVINTREKRLAIAEQYAKAAGLPIEETVEARRVWPPNRVGTATTQKAAGNAFKSGSSSSSAASGEPDESPFLPGGWALWASIAAALAAAGWLLRRSLRMKG